MYICIYNNDMNNINIIICTVHIMYTILSIRSPVYPLTTQRREDLMVCRGPSWTGLASREGGTELGYAENSITMNQATLPSCTTYIQ